MEFANSESWNVLEITYYRYVYVCIYFSKKKMCVCVCVYNGEYHIDFHEYENR